jgi:hypothetical protein
MAACSNEIASMKMHERLSSRKHRKYSSPWSVFFWSLAGSFAFSATSSCVSRKTTLQGAKDAPSNFSRALSANDVATLFFLPSVQQPTSQSLQEISKGWLIPVLDVDGASLLPQNTIPTIINSLSWPTHLDVPKLKKSLAVEDLWSITSFRLACLRLPSREDGECPVTLRLVVQPLQWTDKMLTMQQTNSRAPNRYNDFDPLFFPYNLITTEDAAIHLIYNVDKERVRELLSDVVTLRNDLQRDHGIDTRSFRLGVHPAVDPVSSNEQIRSFFLSRIASLIRTHANYENLHSAEVMVTSGIADANRAISVANSQKPLPIAWTFATFRRNEGGSLAPVPIGRGVAGTIMNSESMSQALSFTSGYLPGLKDTTNTFFEVVREWRTVDARVMTASVALLEKETDEVNRIAAHVDNPANLNIFKGDCVTCHVSSTLRNLAMHSHAMTATAPLRAQMAGTTNEVFAKLAPKIQDAYDSEMFSNYPSQVPAEVEAITAKNVPPVVPDYNLHQFSYFMHRPSISKRAANDIGYDTLIFSEQTRLLGIGTLE